jgi:signal transduction histidine kinase/AmiR/NasT family two-component response regulator
MAESAGAARAVADDSKGVKLFAASARNLLPRLVSNLCVAGVGLVVFGPIWAGLWFLASWTVVFAGMGLMRLIQADPSGPRAAPLNVALTCVNVLSGSVAALMPVALWLSGGELARTFSLITLFIGAAYVLLQYYANLKTFLVLMTPYAVALAYIGYRLSTEHRVTPTVALIVIAAVATLVNFFHLSRLTLDRSRTALRQARAQARAGEHAAEGANEAKSAFLATMSHEIRTPLNGVLGMAQAMAAETLSPVQRERLDIIDQSGKALLAILNDILDLSKIEAGKLELEEIEFDLGDVARGAHSAFTALANKKGLSFALDIDQARGVYRGDPTRLRQILYNLISNALKFTEHGEIRVIAVRIDDSLRITVADTGMGIPPEALAKLFGKFAQVDASTTRRFGGTGLGLSICRQLGELMGGTVGVESRAGQGSTFWADLPLAPAVLPGELLASEASDGERLKHARVLLVEDNPVNMMIAAATLAQWGIEVTEARDGHLAIEAVHEAAWRGRPFDLVLMDVQMPVMSGHEATIELRKGRSPRALPIIALTAAALVSERGLALAAGMNDFLTKPIDAPKLRRTLARHVRKESGTEAVDAG